MAGRILGATKKLLVLGALGFGGMYLFGDSDTEKKDNPKPKQEQKHTYWRGRTLVIDARDTQTIATGPISKKELNPNWRPVAERVATANIPKTSNIETALSKTVDLTSTTKETFQLTGSRSALILPKNQKSFCDNTKKVLSSTYTGEIKGFECDWKAVSVKTNKGITTYSARTNKSITR